MEAEHASYDFYILNFIGDYFMMAQDVVYPRYSLMWSWDDHSLHLLGKHLCCDHVILTDNCVTELF